MAIGIPDRASLTAAQIIDKNSRRLLYQYSEGNLCSDDLEDAVYDGYLRVTGAFRHGRGKIAHP